MKILSRIKECFDYLFFRIGMYVSKDRGGASFSLTIIILIINNFIFAIFNYYNGHLRYPIIISEDLVSLFRICMYSTIIIGPATGALLGDYYLELVEKYRNDSEEARDTKTGYVVIVIVLSVLLFAHSFILNHQKEKKRREQYIHDRWSPPKYYEQDSLQLDL